MWSELIAGPKWGVQQECIIYCNYHVEFSFWTKVFESSSKQILCVGG